MKLGGLADVVGALSKVLAARGHEVAVILPKYAVLNKGFELRLFLNPLGVWMGNTEEWCGTFVTSAYGVRFYFVDFQKYVAHPGLYYDSESRQYRDNARRFGFFARAALQLCRDAAFQPHIVHAHDWPAALTPAYLKIWHRADPILGVAGSVFTIHNVVHQGKYSRAEMDYLGLGWSNFTPDKFEDHGEVNFLKGGIHYADLVTTVSPAYAEETRGAIGGSGLGPILSGKGSHYWGILNGADYDHWDPSHDALIPARYGPENMSGKAICKRELQRRLMLQERPVIPIIGIIGRFVEQKGFHLLARSMEAILNTMHVQFAILGAGEKDLEWTFGPLPSHYPGRVGAYIGHHEELAHWIEAGADFLIMPSLYEPCGLNQLYSLRYGTLPIVRAIGGLNDTVQQYKEATGEGTGFKFFDRTAQAV